MKTFYEEIVSAGTSIEYPESIYPNRILKSLDECQIIIIDNVAEYVFSSIFGQKEDNSIVTILKNVSFLNDFPNCAPVFENMFFEFKIPEIYKPFGHKCGVFINGQEIDDGWSLRCFCWINQHPEGVISLIPILLDFGVSKEGKLKITDKGKLFMAFSLSTTEREKKMEKLIWNMLLPDVLIKIPLLALSFMHCKNVKRQEYIPKKHIGHSKTAAKAPKVKHYTLEIDPMKKVLEVEGGCSRNGLKKAMHICRGHFKNFDDRPLFGKYTGTYWWHDQVRGDIKNGLVEKDYSVLTPKTECA